MGPPAARIGDMHTCPLFDGPKPHVGGPVLPPAAPTVLIGTMPAARVGDMAMCASAPDVIVKGSLGVFIGGRPAARVGDPTAHGGVIVVGFPTVLIGDIGSGGVGSVQAVTLSAAKKAGVPFCEKCQRAVTASIRSSDIGSGGAGSVAPPSRSDAGTNDAGCAVAPCVGNVTVAITLSAPVGCPGRALPMTAVGTPSGGTYAWTVSGGSAELADSTGARASTGPSVNLRSFKANDAKGKIPEQTATVRVTYTHANGTATDSKPVKIHKIEFNVTNKAITTGFTAARESAAGVRLWWAVRAEMSTDPDVTIQLDASCPNKPACAANHRVGWLQTMLTAIRQARYTHTSLDIVASTPIRDAWNPTVFPFYSTVTPFSRDNDKQTAHHEDSPDFPTRPLPWTDPRAGQLRRMRFEHTFTAWLVVQNIEWAAHDLASSFAFQGHFDWSMQLNVTVDTRRGVGSSVTPKRNRVTAPARIQAGKGSATPNLAAPTFNSSAVLKLNAASGI